MAVWNPAPGNIPGNDLKRDVLFHAVFSFSERFQILKSVHISILHLLLPLPNFSDERCDSTCQMWEMCVCALCLQVQLMEFQEHIAEAHQLHKELGLNMRISSDSLKTLDRTFQTEPLCGRPKKSRL